MLRCVALPAQGDEVGGVMGVVGRAEHADRDEVVDLGHRPGTAPLAGAAAAELDAPPGLLPPGPVVVLIAALPARVCLSDLELREPLTLTGGVAEHPSTVEVAAGAGDCLAAPGARLRDLAKSARNGTPGPGRFGADERAVELLPVMRSDALSASEAVVLLALAPTSPEVAAVRAVPAQPPVGKRRDERLIARRARPVAARRTELGFGIGREKLSSAFGTYSRSKRHDVIIPGIDLQERYVDIGSEAAG